MSAIKHFSGSAQLAFETYAARNRNVLISPQTGEGILRIPIPGLHADASASPSFMLGLSCKTYRGDLNVTRFGVVMTDQATGGKSQDHFTNLPLCDGRSLTFEMNSGETFNGGDLLIERDGTDVVVSHKNGACETFIVSQPLVGTGGSTGPSGGGWIYRVRYVSPSGRSLTYKWTEFAAGPRVTAINDDDGQTPTSYHGHGLHLSRRGPSAVTRRSEPDGTLRSVLTITVSSEDVAG